MEAVDVQIQKYKKEEEKEQLEGGHVSAIDLEQRGWTKLLGYSSAFHSLCQGHDRALEALGRCSGAAGYE